MKHLEQLESILSKGKLTKNPSRWMASSWWRTIGFYRIEKWLEENGMIDLPRIPNALELAKTDRRAAAEELLKKHTLPKVYKLKKDKKGVVTRVWDKSKVGKAVVPAEIARMLWHPSATPSRIPVNFLKRVPWPELTTEEVPELQEIFCEWWDSTTDAVSMFKALAASGDNEALQFVLDLYEQRLEELENEEDEVAISIAKIQIGQLRNGSLRNRSRFNYTSDRVGIVMIRDGIEYLARAVSSNVIGTLTQAFAQVLRSYAENPMLVQLNWTNDGWQLDPQSLETLRDTLRRYAEIIRTNKPCPSIEAVMASNRRSRY